MKSIIYIVQLMDWIVIMRDWQWHITLLLISRYWSVHVGYNGAPPSEAVWGWEDVQWSQSFLCVYEAVGRVHGRAGSQAMHFRSLVGISNLTGNMACAFYQHPKMWQFIASDTSHVPALYWCMPFWTNNRPHHCQDWFSTACTWEAASAAHTLSTRCKLLLGELE